MTTHTALGPALRAWRERIGPAAVGLPTAGNRRVPGLRREELAVLAGISVDYLVQLEQGRAKNPSPQVLAAFAQTLRLNAVDRELLYRLAGAVVPPSGTVPRDVPPGVQRMIDRMSDTPLAVFTASWDLVQSNRLWAELFGSPVDAGTRSSNQRLHHVGYSHGTQHARPDRERCRRCRHP